MALVFCVFLKTGTHSFHPVACTGNFLKFEKFYCHRSLTNHSDRGSGNENQLLNFDIPMLLGNSYIAMVVTIFRNSHRTTAMHTP